MANTTDSTFTVMTAAGLALAAQIQGGLNSIASFRAVGSDTSYYDKPGDVEGLTDLTPVKQTGVVVSVNLVDSSAVQVQIDFDLTKVDAYYALSSVGLFATDKNGKEILYAVECNQHAQPMDVSTTGDMNSHYMTIIVGNAQQLNVSVSPAGSVSRSELEARLANLLDTDKLKQYLTDNKIATEAYVNDQVKAIKPAAGTMTLSDDNATVTATTKDGEQTGIWVDQAYIDQLKKDILAMIVDPNSGKAKIKMDFAYGDLTVDGDHVTAIEKVADEVAAKDREIIHPNTQHEWGES